MFFFVLLNESHQGFHWASGFHIPDISETKQTVSASQLSDLFYKEGYPKAFGSVGLVLHGLLSYMFKDQVIASVFFFDMEHNWTVKVVLLI